MNPGRLQLLLSSLFRGKKLDGAAPLRPRKEVIRAILDQPDLGRLFATLARREGCQERHVRRRAKAILREMAADLNLAHLALSRHVFRWFWKRLYSGPEVDEAGIEKLRRFCRDHPVILCPSHRSHVDYLLLSAVLYEQGIVPPLIAAGANLNFWPIGWIFRGNGAFFIRRRITAGILYARLLESYVQWLVRNRYTQEIFIEGGRTRTGKLRPPMRGLLDTQLECVFDGSVRDLYIVPAAVTYERVVEEAAYRAELRGERKRQENLLTLLRSSTLLARKYGDAFVRFGEPISAREYVGLGTGRAVAGREKRERTARLSADILRRVAAETVVTATALTCTALLADSGNEISETALRERLGVLADYLRGRRAPCAPQVPRIAAELSPILRDFAQRGWVALARKGSERTVTVAAEKRITVDFYKNMVLHYFLAPAIEAAAVRASPPGRPHRELASFLRELLAHEFFLSGPDEGAPSASGEAPAAAGEQRSRRELFAGLIGNYIEAYGVAARLALSRSVDFPLAPESERAALEFGLKCLQSGEISRPEAVTTALLASALTFLHDRGLLARPEKLAAWHEKLALLR